MQSKLVGFVQPNFQQGPQELQAYYLPYSAGVILAYALSHEHIQKQWKLGTLVWRRDLVDTVAQQLSQCDVVGFSTYVWNHQYNTALAKKIKQINPECTIVFGGPQPAVTDPDIFVKNPFIDIVVKMEGEITFKNILQHHGGDLTAIPGILLNQQGTVLDTGDSKRINDLDQLPSPYLAGIFDQIVKDNPTITWNATLETNRGCPYACTFCDWGSLTYNKVKKFGLERVYSELEWIGQNCGFVTITDANFGMFVERDNLIIDKLIEVQSRWGKVTSFAMSWAKNQKNDVVYMVKRLIDDSPNFGQGLTVSVQSMDYDVLENIKRRNLDQHKIDEIFALCDRNNIPVYTEIILGLPGDTVEAWKENFWKIFRAGNHTGINILQAQLLENAEMNLFQKKLWKLDSVPVYDYMSGSFGDMQWPESVDVVIATRDIPQEQMLDTMQWNTFIQTFHINGMSTWLARFVHKYLGVDYPEFYQALEKHCQSHAWLHAELNNTRDYFKNWLTKGYADHPDIGNAQIFGWNLVHRVTLYMYQQHQIDSVMTMLETFMQQYRLEPQLLDQLMKFQRNYVIDHATMQQLPKIEQFDYDFQGYLLDDAPLENQCQYTFDTMEDKTMDFTRFLESVYFSRKRNFGKSLITKMLLDAVDCT
jgi:hypothetical protein